MKSILHLARGILSPGPVGAVQAEIHATNRAESSWFFALLYYVLLFPLAVFLGLGPTCVLLYPIFGNTHEGIANRETASTMVQMLTAPTHPPMYMFVIIVSAYATWLSLAGSFGAVWWGLMFVWSCGSILARHYYRQKLWKDGASFWRVEKEIENFKNRKNIH